RMYHCGVADADLERGQVALLRRSQHDDVVGERRIGDRQTQSGATLPEESAIGTRPVDMNSAINNYSAAQRHVDAIREARRNPIAAVPARERRAPVYSRNWLLAAVARHAQLRPLLVRASGAAARSQCAAHGHTRRQ